MDTDHLRSEENRNTASSPTNIRNAFICTVCFKVFQSGPALGGHQNSHLSERSQRQTTPNILGAVLNHTLPPDDVRSLAAALAAGSNNKDQDHPSTVRSKHGYERRKRWRRQTKNLLGERKPIKAAAGSCREAAGSSSSSDTSTTSMVDSSIDLELRLKTSEYIDLELKLGF